MFCEAIRCSGKFLSIERFWQVDASFWKVTVCPGKSRDILEGHVRS